MPIKKQSSLVLTHEEFHAVYKKTQTMYEQARLNAERFADVSAATVDPRDFALFQQTQANFPVLESVMKQLQPIKLRGLLDREKLQERRQDHLDALCLLPEGSKEREEALEEYKNMLEFETYTLNGDRQTLKTIYEILFASMKAYEMALSNYEGMDETKFQSKVYNKLYYLAKTKKSVDFTADLVKKFEEAMNT